MGQPDRVLLEAAERGETSRFVFRTPSGSGTVWVEDGQPVDAVIHGVGGERALVRILSNRCVRFAREPGPRARSRRIVRPIAEYVEEVSRRRRAWADVVTRLPPLSDVLVQVSSPGLAATPDALSLIRHVDGKRPLFALIDECGLDALAALVAIEELLEARVLSSATSAEGRGDGALEVAADLPRQAEMLASLAEPREDDPESPVFLLVRPASELAAARPVVGRYEVLGRLGRGGMATVYLCRTRGEAGFTRRFAMKVLRTHLSDDAEAAAMLLREARFTGRLHHPNVVSVVDVGSNRGQPYLVMDYVAGCSAATLLEAAERGALVLSERVAAAVTLDALAGLHAAHTLGDSHGEALGLVHQDVSPENLLVGFDGVTRVSDFGVAQVTSALATDGDARGKPQYLAPERVLGQSFDHRADIFALGVVFYRLLTGALPFAADSAEETFRAILSGPVTPPSAAGKRPLAVFDEVCMRALERSADDRFQSAEHFRVELLRAAVLSDQLAPAGEVAEAARRAVDALSPGSRLHEGAGEKRASARAAPGEAIVLLPRKSRAKPKAPNDTVELAAPRKAIEPTPLPLWAVAVFLVVSIGLALALESLGGEGAAPPRVPAQAQTPQAPGSASDPFGPGFLEQLSEPAPSAEPSPAPTPP